jgi:hypothetical protein
MKQKNQLIALALLVLAAVGVWYWQWYEPKTGSKVNNSTFLQSYQTLNFPNPEIRWNEVERRRKAEYKGAGVNPFSTVVPPDPADVRKAEDDARKIADAHKNDPPPPPPELKLPDNLKFFGYGNVPNNTARRAFLEDGEEVYIVNEGDTLMGRFKILKINNASLEFEEVGSGRRGQKMLEDQGQGPTA